MNVNIELTDKILAQFGIEKTDDLESIQNKLLNGIDEKIPVSFKIKALRDVYVDKEAYFENEITWNENCEYNVEYFDNIGFLADSETSDFTGTLLSEGDFLNFFEVIDASPFVAKYMCNEGYGDMFVNYLDKSEIKLIKSIEKDMHFFEDFDK